MIDNLTAVILLGGASSRMGSPKHLLQYPGGRTVLEHLLSTIKKTPDIEHIIVAYREGSKETLTRSSAKIDVPIQYVCDSDLEEHAPHLPLDLAGPAAGILAAHFTFPASHLLMIACDFPLIQDSTLQQLVGDYKDPVTCFKNQEGFMEPLLSIWSPSALQALASNVYDRNYGPSYTVKTLNGHQIVPKDQDWLHNANTPEEWQQALRLFQVK